MKRLLFFLLLPCLVQAQSNTPVTNIVGELSWKSLPTIVNAYTGSIQISRGVVGFEQEGRIVKGELQLDTKSLKRKKTEAKSSIEDIQLRAKQKNSLMPENSSTATIRFIGVRYDLCNADPSRFGLALSFVMNDQTETINLPATLGIDKEGYLTLKAFIPMSESKKNEQSSIFTFISLENETTKEIEIVITIDLKTAGC